MTSLEDCDINILYESDNFIIVDKPPDLLINSDDENNMNTLHRKLMPIFKDYINTPNLKHGFHFVHRLDYATSGLICLAKNKYASSSAGKLFESRQADKYYIALVRGNVEDELTTVDIPIGYDKRFLDCNKKMCATGENCIVPKKAITKILVLDRGFYNGEPATKIMLKPLTGRRHQLRLHCHLLGHNIIGDYTYSDRKDVQPPRMFLHSYRLILPVKNESIDFCTEDPFTSRNEMCKAWISKRVINEINNGDELSSFDKLNNFDVN